MKRLKVIFKTIKLFTLVVSTFLLSNNANAQGPRSTRPSITSVSPTSGPEGTLVTIDGINFINATTVKIKNLSVPFTIVDSFTITFVVPVGATSGQIIVENPSGKANGGRFIVIPPLPQPPTITSFSPISDSVGYTVTIVGTNFDNVTLVTLNGQSVVFNVIDSITIEFTVPVGATSGLISITNPDGSATSSTSFTVLMPYVPTPPIISSFAPSSGPIGTTVTVIGNNFSSATSLSLNGNSSIPFTIVNNNTITFVVPNGATSGLISITNPDGTATSSTSYIVTIPIFPPTITSINPTSGLVGTTVTITGTNLNTVTSVSLNGTSLTFTIVNNTSITFVVPIGATSGIVSVTNPDGSASGPVFTVTLPPTPPTITTISPTSGLVGTIVTVNGTNFTTVTNVTLNGLNVSFNVNSPTELIFIVPTGATSGIVSVINPDGTANGPIFTVTLPPTPPTITSISPTSGPVGTTVNINGTYFNTVTTVRLNGNSVAFNINTATNITFVVPAGATSGIVSVTNPDGTANGPNYTVTVPVPTISSISPTSGPIGTTVTITGTNFTGATAVRLNGTLVTYNLVSSSSITFVVPAGATTGVVSVTTPGGTATGPTYTVTTVTLPVVTRGAYMVGPKATSINIQWRTDIASNSEVWYGTNPSFLGWSVSNTSNVTDHTISLTGLTPNTKYYYSVGVIGTPIQSGTNNTFMTANTDTSTETTRFWVTGDFGNNSTNQRNVLTAFNNYTSTGLPVRAWLWLGDNAYSNGTDAEYTTNVFNVYGNLFNKLPVLPELGNHDYGQTGYLSSTSRGTTAPYFNIFAIPTNSGTEKYYSTDYGNVHFIGLDSYGSYNSLTSPMYAWLQNDLANNKLPWVVVYWHHPPYTKGSHDSDTEIELIDMRTNIVPLLEQYGVDLVLGGHSHIYERSKFIKDHFGLESTFDNNLYPFGNVVQSSTNNFTKSSLRGDGTVYVVCGVSGQAGGSTSAGYPHNAMQVSTSSNNGSLILDINNNTLNCKFLTTSGTIFDQFTISKTIASPRMGSDRQLPLISNEEYYDISGRYLGSDYKDLPTNQLIIYRYKKDGEPQVRKIIKTN